jgi:Domain of unknown function (DU1801)
MISSAKTVDEYLGGLPPDRRSAISAVREVILAHLPKGYTEVMQNGMISYVVPHSIYPKGYHCKPSEPLPYASLGSQKNHMAIYLCNVYGHKETETWFRKAYEASGKRLDMGKSCVRFKTVEQLPLEVIGQVIARTPVDKYIAGVEAALNRTPGRPDTSLKSTKNSKITKPKKINI